MCDDLDGVLRRCVRRADEGVSAGGVPYAGHGAVYVAVGAAAEPLDELEVCAVVEGDDVVGKLGLSARGRAGHGARSKMMVRGSQVCDSL